MSQEKARRSAPPSVTSCTQMSITFYRLSYKRQGTLSQWYPEKTNSLT